MSMSHYLTKVRSKVGKEVCKTIFVRRMSDGSWIRVAERYHTPKEVSVTLRDLGDATKAKSYRLRLSNHLFKERNLFVSYMDYDTAEYITLKGIGSPFTSDEIEALMTASDVKQVVNAGNKMDNMMALIYVGVGAVIGLFVGYNIIPAIMSGV